VSAPPTLADHVARAAVRARMPKAHVARAARYLLTEIFESAWQHGRAELAGFLTLRTALLKPRGIQNPITHERMQLPAERVLAARVVRRWRRRRV
jgi:nucleoid DNA-binding protein